MEKYLELPKTTQKILQIAAVKKERITHGEGGAFWLGLLPEVSVDHILRSPPTLADGGVLAAQRFVLDNILDLQNNKNQITPEITQESVNKFNNIVSFLDRFPHLSRKHRSSPLELRYRYKKDSDPDVVMFPYTNILKCWGVPGDINPIVIFNHIDSEIAMREDVQQKCRDFADELGLNVEFMPEDVPDCIRGGKAAVIVWSRPQVIWREPVVIEATKNLPLTAEGKELLKKTIKKNKERKKPPTMSTASRVFYGDAVVRVGYEDLRVPVGYIHILWKQVKEGDVVYVIGKKNGASTALGPFKVVSSQQRILFNMIQGRSGPESNEILLRLVS